MDGFMSNMFYNPYAGLLGPEEDARLQQAARSQGLLNIAANLLAAGGPSAQPQGLGQALARGVIGGQQAAQDVYMQGVRGAVMREQMAETQRKREREQQLRELAPRLFQAQTTPLPTTGAYDAGQGLDVMEGGVGAVEQPRVTGFRINTELLPALGALGPEGMAYAKNVAEFQKSLQPEYLTVGESVYMKSADGLKPVVSAGGKFTGDFANIAVGLYGTANAQDILAKDPNAFPKIQQGVLEKQRAGATSINLPSEGERKAGFLANRVKFGIEQMADVIGKNPPAASPEMLPTAIRFLTGTEFLPNKLTSENRQRVEAAQIDILDAALTLGTGAAYTREQLEGYRKSYFPQLGDNESTIKDKQKRLENLLRSSYVSAGRAAPAGEIPSFAPPVAAPKGGKESKAAKTSKAPSGVDQRVWDVMTPEERKLWQ